MPHITKYNARWPDSMPPLEIELKCIEWGGKWRGKDGNECGLGLFEHFMNARRILWPDRYRHRWIELMYQNFIENEVTILMGCGSSGKTSCAAEYALLRYWSRPNDTLVMLSTTTLQKLQMAIYGELKMLWQEGKDKFDWLAGNPIEYKHAISTDNIEDGSLRDLRKGIIGIACYEGRQFVGLGCFPAGTLVDTPTGPNPIEFLGEGDLVIGALGPRRIKKRSIRNSDRLIRVHFKSGTFIDCTPEHPFFTSLGWVSAIDLDSDSYVLSPNEALRILSQSHSERSPEDEILFQILQGEIEGKALRSVPLPVHSSRRTNDDLQQGMSEHLEEIKSNDNSNVRQAVSGVRKNDGEFPFQTKVLQRDMRVGELQEGLRLVQEAIRSIRCSEHILLQALHDEGTHVPSRVQGEDAAEYGSSGSRPKYQKVSEQSSRGNRSSTEKDERNVSETASNSTQDGIEEFSRESRPNPIGDYCSSIVSRGKSKSLSSNGSFFQAWTVSGLLDRLGLAGTETSRRIGRFLSRKTEAKGKGSTERQFSSGAWVDRVEILEQGCDKRYDVRKGGYQVFNLEVEGHPSYSINNLLVHNSYAGIKQRNIVFIADELQFCPPTFLACLPNMFQNPNVKVIGSGNPKHDPYDQLGQAAEPIGGWGSLGEITKTTRWPIKFHKGYCVNLVGPDSPNFDYPEDEPIRFPRLINRKTIQRVEARWPKNSLEWCKQCSGVMQIGMVGNRVITQHLCEKHKAFDRAIWKDGHRTKIGFLDPAWGGVNADRCVWGFLEFGEDISGVQIIRVTEPIVIPVLAGQNETPEDQIANRVKEEAKSSGIPTENIFYDSTGKGTLGYSFARVFGHSTPVPIAFDGKASDRPVRHDLFVMDKGVKRLKKCVEHYSKYVTELWFNVRYVIESQQMREMPQSAVTEFCMREYYPVSGDRLEVEPKDETRERMGESPDIADAVAVGVCGAIQRGFKIKRLGLSDEIDDDKFQWLNDRVRKHEELIKSKQLNYA